jgi:hypothetical protein
MAKMLSQVGIRRARRPKSTWKSGNAAEFCEQHLMIPPGSIVFLKSDGNRAEPNETVGALRAKGKPTRMTSTLAVPARHPPGTQRLGNAAIFCEDFLLIPRGSVLFVKPDGKRAEPTETLGSLRAKGKPA